SDFLAIGTVQAIGYPEYRGQTDDSLLLSRIKQIEILMLARSPAGPAAQRSRAPVIAGNRCHYCGFLSCEPGHLRVLDQVEGVAVMVIMCDVITDVVEQRRILEEFAFPSTQGMYCASLIEYLDRESRDMVGMSRVVVVSPGDG